MSYKLVTHDYRPPVRGGEPIWDGVTLPYDLPMVELDVSDAECAPGWYSVDAIEEAIPVVGLWPDGYPVGVLEVERLGRVHVPPGGKPRSGGLRIIGRALDSEVYAAIGRWTEGWAGEHAEVMTREQIAWYEALGRPGRNAVAVEDGLRAALKARGLGWALRRYPTGRAARAVWDARDAQAARNARAAWAAWTARDAWAVRDVQDAWDAWAARNVQAAWDAWAARNARAVWDAWAARDPRAVWDAWAARAVWDARDALSLYHAVAQGWTSSPQRYTIGIRDAYRAGLGVAVPVESAVLGWAMEGAEG